MNGEGNLALFCDFENIALGVRDANIEKFDVQLVIERLLLMGSIVAKKAYCDWERYKSFKSAMHEAAFELIEIPHARQSGKNSADIRMVVDALDLCYTKEHIDSFVIISGDSDFSPLVSKLRENAKSVIGVGVKSSTSELLMNNCDEFIFYDDLAADRKPARRRMKSKGRTKTSGAAKSDASGAHPRHRRRSGAAAGDRLGAADGRGRCTRSGAIARRCGGSMIKQTLKRRRPGFNESSYGFGSFNDVLEEAQSRGLVELELDERSGGYLIRRVNR